MTEKVDNIKLVEQEIDKVSKSGEKTSKNNDNTHNLEAGKSDADVKVSIFRQHAQPYFEIKADSGNRLPAMPDNEIRQIMSKDAKGSQAPLIKKHFAKRKISNSLNNAPILPK